MEEAVMPDTPEVGRVPQPPIDRVALDQQRGHWASTFVANPDMYGTQPSTAAVAAAGLFLERHAASVLELGAGQGRDTLYFARQGLRVHALDYTNETVESIRTKAENAGLADLVDLCPHDVREPLPFDDSTFDACYSHMLFCMALTTPELERLAAEVRRILRPGGLCVYTVRTTGDAHYRASIDRGDEMYESGGFIVHFFSRALVERLAAGYDLLDVSAFEEGALPRRLFRVTLQKVEQ
jgi:SAM-dependent methyltransferase